MMNEDILFTNWLKIAELDLKMEVAENPNSPVNFLEILAKDPDPHIRITVAENPNTPTCILKMLVEDSNPWVKMKVVQRFIVSSQ